MVRKSYFNKFCLLVVFSLMAVLFCSNAFARGIERSGHHEQEYVRVGLERYNYHDGRFFRPGWVGFKFSIGVPSIGVVVSSLPFGSRTIVVKNTPYYYYGDVYYKHCPSGYVVVPQPVLISNVRSNSLSQSTNKETITVDISDLNGGSVTVTLIRFANGFVGPKGEFYSQFPSVEQLRARYR